MQMIGKQKRESSAGGGVLVCVAGHMEVLGGQKLFGLSPQRRKIGISAFLSA
jgi:hypothetical protein